MAKKNINPRCPLALECERKHCEYITHEIDCKYYETNGWGESSIPDQEERRKAREEEHDRLLEGMEYEAILDEEENSANKKESQSKIVMLRVDKLHEHPDNPRKDVGDVSELAESIKANGILQNLTVVAGHYMSKDEYIKMAKAEGMTKAVAESAYDAKEWPRPDEYTVIIGHRRLAAAKLAGLKEVPCSISDMSPEEQIATMLTENMQRTDLTVYEQAKAFQQLTFDLGMSASEIADMSGFSETTVRRRTKLAELDEKAFKKACERGATLADFAKLEQIEDPKAKQTVLEAMGTNNFQNQLRGVMEDQKAKEKIAKYLEVIKTFATEDPSASYQNKHYVRNYGRWSNGDVVVPEDAATRKYYYRVSENEIDLYTDRDFDKEAKERAEREEKDRRRAKLKESFEDITGRHRDLRRDFVHDLSASACKKKLPEIVCFSTYVESSPYSDEMDYDDLAYCMGIEIGADENAEFAGDIEAVKDIAKTAPEKLLLSVAYCSLDTGSYGYYCQAWRTDAQEYQIVHKENDTLDRIYNILTELGYEMSDEEIKMQNGTHELFSHGGTANE